MLRRRLRCFCANGHAKIKNEFVGSDSAAGELPALAAIAVGDADTTWHLPPQHNQLISERGVLCLKPALRLEWRNHDGQDKI